MGVNRLAIFYPAMHADRNRYPLFFPMAATGPRGAKKKKRKKEHWNEEEKSRFATVLHGEHLSPPVHGLPAET